MGVVIYMKDFRQVNATLAVPEFSNFWVELSLSVFNAWLKTCSSHLSPPSQVIPFVQARACSSLNRL
jgi:hypothetical protein